MESMSFVAVAPEVALLVGVLAVLLVEITLEPDRRVLGAIAGAAVVAALAGSVWQWAHVADVGALDQYSRMIRLDAFTAFGGIAVFTVTGIALLGLWPMVIPMGRRGAELIALVLLSAMGLHLMAAAGNLIMLFVALEIASISLYVVAGFTRERADADESATKYFLLGSFASAVFLYGVALLYAATGSTYLYGTNSVSQVLVETYFRSPGVLLAAIALLIVGLGFKVSAAPFHQWAPDVYQGAPSGAVGFMSAGVKVAGFAAIGRVLIGGLGTRIDDWGPAIAVIAAVSIIVGTGLAIAQTDIKRMLAYSGVAHAGFILTGVLAGGDGMPAVWFYVATYAVQLVGAFVVVSIVDGPTAGRSAISDYGGLAARSPFLAGSMAVLLLGLGGIPFTSGFIGKFTVFQAAAEAGYLGLVILALLGSVAGLFFYLRVIVVMFFETPAVAMGPGADTASLEPERPPGYALAISVGLTVAFGIVPWPLLELVSNALPL